MSVRPLVSVVLPTYNRAKTLQRAIESVLNQTFSDFELIIIDDRSTDGTDLILRKYAGRERLRVMSQLRPGCAVARNIGVRVASGRYVAFQDSDDEWLADKLAYQVARMEALPEDVAMTQAAILRFQGQGTECEYYLSNLPTESHQKQLEGILPINMTSFTQAWLLRREVIGAVGDFDERLPLWEDWELMIRILEKYRVDIDKKPVAVVYDTPGGLTAQDKVRPAAFRLIVERHRELMGRYPMVLAQNLYIVGRMDIVAEGQAERGRKAVMESLRLNPRQLKGWVLLLTSIGGAWPARIIARTRFRLRSWMWQMRQRWYRRRDPFKA